jgi:hypothetical protein
MTKKNEPQVRNDGYQPKQAPQPRPEVKPHVGYQPPPAPNNTSPKPPPKKP